MNFRLLALLGALSLGLFSARAAVLVDDTFADGASRNQNLASNSLNVFDGRTGAAGTSGGVNFTRTDAVGSMTLNLSASTSSQGAWGFFTGSQATTSAALVSSGAWSGATPVTLQVGDTITFTETFSIANLKSGQDLRLGLFDSGGSRNTANDTGGQNDATFANDLGYSVDFFLAGSTTPFAIGKRDLTLAANLSALNNLFLQMGAFPNLPGASGATMPALQTLTSGVPYTLTMSVFRQDASTDVITVNVTGANITGPYGWQAVDTNAPQITFDAFTGARFNGSSLGDSMTFTEFKVVYSPALPVITAQPTFASGNTSQVVPVGGQAILSVGATGANLTYQWKKDGNPVTGATTATVTLTNLQLTDSGSYTVDVTNGSGTITSNALTLSVVDGTVNVPPNITTQPVAQTVLNGSNVNFSVGAVGEGLTYQWYKDTVVLSGQTGASLSLPAVQASDAGSYAVTVSNDGGSSPSAAVTLTVLSPNLASPTLSPTNAAAGLCIDTPLRIAFSSAPSFGATGTIKVYDALTDAAVDTIDIGSPSQTGNISFLNATPYQTKTIGGTANFSYYPVIITGNTAAIYLRNNVLAYNRSYYVKIDSGVFKDSLGVYSGINDKTTWRFTTKAAAPAAGSTTLTVAADGSGDFCTVQGAIDFVPANNATRTTIFIRKGTYTEMVYFANKNALTFLGEDRKQTIVTYPNNNNFNPVGGVYHRGVFFGNNVADTVVTNFTIVNSTPQNGSQAEALIMNGSLTAHTIVTSIDLYSFQDTLQMNGQAYLSNNYVEGDVDFMWGTGPCFFENCSFKILRTGGYFTQIRNDNTRHGFVFLNCKLSAGNGINGTYLGRIDPTAAGFPFSEVVWLNCSMGNFVIPAGWLLNNATTAPTVHFWEYNSTDELGNPLDVNGRAPFSLQLKQPDDATTIANYSTPSYVLGGWTPVLAPIVTTQPMGATVDVGGALTLTAAASGVPAPTFQWFKDGVAIPGATSATYTIPAVSASDVGGYSVMVTNGTTSTSSGTALVWLTGTVPSITSQPRFTATGVGGSLALSVTAAGTAPFTYQWKHDGVIVAGATGPALPIANAQVSDMGMYSVQVSNLSGTITSNSALLTVSANPNAAPPLPTWVGATYDVTTYGAVADGVTDNTIAIQNAINTARTAGGGTILFPAATKAYESGPLTIYSNMNLQIELGATLQALPFGVYPRSTTAPAHFITINTNSTNVIISGSGTIDGNGDAWWTAFNNSTITSRPRLVQINHVDTMLITGVTLRNAAMFHLAFSATNNVTIAGVTISSPSTSPNTDGIDPAGLHYLIENSTIGVGDDNIAVKPGGIANGDLTVVNCAFGVGHGVSIGGQTNDGLSGMIVDHCTFNGTATGLRMKADPTEGGLVQNVSYSNLTMVNVPSPIVFYSYYNLVGSPGATSGSSQTTPAKVNADNTTPPNALNTTTLPAWKNISITNLTATGASAYSIIWGLPLADELFQNVTLTNVQISGGTGFEIYDATNVQFIGNNSVGPIITANALALTSQPQNQAAAVGASASFTVVTSGTSGITSTAPTYQWNLNGAPLTDGTQADGSMIAGSTSATLSLSNLQNADAGNYTVTVSNQLDGYNVAASSLATNSLPVSMTSQVATLTLANAFTTFASGFGLDPATTGAFTADPDGDGISNGLEFVLGGDPTKNDRSILPTSTVMTVDGTPHLVFEFNQKKVAAGLVTTTVEYSTDLANWTSATDGQNGVAIITTPVDAATDHITVTIPSTSTQLFARLKLSM